MKRIAKLAQGAVTATSSRQLARAPIFASSSVRPLAGPSSYARPLPPRSQSYAAVSPLDPSTSGPAASEAGETGLEQESVEDSSDILVDSAILDAGHGRRPLEIPRNVVIPPNVRFEGFEHVEEPVPRGFRLHQHSKNTLTPILHPLSSLASSNPTSAATSTSPANSPRSPSSSISLPPHVFAQPLRRDILHRCVVWYLSLLRQGNQSTKTRSTINYTGRKLRQQKGTGKARVGDASSGIRRGGAPIFPLHPRDHAQLLPRKVRALGLATALSSKLSSGLLRIVSDLNEAEWNGTADARRALCDGPLESIVVESPDDLLDADLAASDSESFIRRFGTSKDLSVLFVYPPPTTAEHADRLEAFSRSVRNLPGVEVLGSDEVEVYHILKYKWTVLERGVVDGITEIEGETDVDEIDLAGLDLQEGEIPDGAVLDSEAR